VTEKGGVADSAALRARRKRLHAAGDHSTCRPGCEHRLRVASADDMPGLVAAVQGEFPESDPLVRALALKLAQAAVESHGTAGVQALRALGGLVAAQRGGS
jgi:hypothetical protein